MLFLLDTNAFSDLMSKHPRMDWHLANLPATDRVATCSVVRGEIRYGIERLAPGRRWQELEVSPSALFTIIPCESVPAAAGDYYATVKVGRQKQGLTLDENDLWVAATALALSPTLVTRDTDFQQITGLMIEDWTT